MPEAEKPVAEKKESFWTTLPGILTGIAALTTAVTGLWVATGPHSTIKDSVVVSTAAPATVTTPQAGSSATPAASAPAAATPAAHTGVTVISRKGVTTHLAAATFHHNSTDDAIQLSSGQTIAFEKIKAIDFLSVDDNAHLVAVSVRLGSGATVAGSLGRDYAFQGESDLGPFSIFVSDARQIVFQ